MVYTVDRNATHTYGNVTGALGALGAESDASWSKQECRSLLLLQELNSASGRGNLEGALCNTAMVLIAACETPTEDPVHLATHFRSSESPRG